MLETEILFETRKKSIIEGDELNLVKVEGACKEKLDNEPTLFNQAHNLCPLYY